MKNQAGLTDPFSSPIDGSISLQSGYTWIGNANNIAIPMANISLSNLPALQNGYVWVGNANNTPSPQVYNPGSGGLPTGGALNQVLQSTGNNSAVWGVKIVETSRGNLGVGSGSLTSNSGLSSVAVGYNALNVSQGNFNTAVGYNVLGTIQTGDQNTAVGYSSLSFCTAGNSNTAVGYETLAAFKIGNYNTAIGNCAMFASNNCTYNTALGNNALYNATGSNNTAVGAGALTATTSGTNNTAVGFNASAGPYSINTTVIGANAQASVNNSIILGDGTCNLGIGTSSPNYGIHMGPTNGTFNPQLYLTGLASLPTTVLSSSSDAVLYANNGNLYYGNSISASNQLMSTAQLSNYVTSSSLTSTLGGYVTTASLGSSLPYTITRNQSQQINWTSSGTNNLIHTIPSGGLFQTQYTGTTSQSGSLNPYTLTYYLGANFANDHAFFLNYTGPTTALSGNVFQFWPDSAGAGTSAPQFKFNVPVVVNSSLSSTGNISGSSLTSNGTITATGVIYANATNSSSYYIPANTTYAYLNQGGTGNFTQSQAIYTSVFSIVANARIKATEFDAISSKNIKNIISRDQEAMEQEALDILDKIEVVKYTYKDSIKDGTGLYYGVIAEELAEVLPDYVNRGEGYVGNIMSLASVIKTETDNHYQILFDRPLSETTMSTDLQIKISNLENQQERDVSVKIIENKVDSLIIECQEDLPKKVFVYGTFESCPAVAKDRLAELALLGVKSLLAEVKDLSVDQQDNQETVNQLRQTINQLNDKILALESRL